MNALQESGAVVLKGVEAIRKRSPMYLGDVGKRGLARMVLSLAQITCFADLECDLKTSWKEGLRLGFSVELKGGSILLDLKKHDVGPWGIFNPILLAIALSETSSLTFLNLAGEQFKYDFIEGLCQGQNLPEPCSITSFELDCQLDKSIWRLEELEDETWLTSVLSEVAFLSPKSRFEITGASGGINIFQYPNGLKTKLMQQSFYLPAQSVAFLENGRSKIKSETNTGFLDWAFLISGLKVDVSPESYVNFDRMLFHGSHLSGFRRGLKLGIQRYFDEKAPEFGAKIHWYNLAPYLICSVHAVLDNPEFEGCTKMKLNVEGLDDEIAAVVAEDIYERMVKMNKPGLWWAKTLSSILGETEKENHRKFSDEEFVSKFEAQELSPEDFTHEAHIRYAFLGIRKNRHGDPADIISENILRFVESIGAGSKFDAELTKGAVGLIRTRMLYKKDLSFPEFLVEHPDLINNFKKALEDYLAGPRGF